MDDLSGNNNWELVEKQPHWRYSTAGLFRAVALLAMAIAWVKLVTTARSPVPEIVVVITSVPLATIVGYRREGGLFSRYRAGIGFFLGGLILAAFTGLVVQTINEYRVSSTINHPLAAFGPLFSSVAVVVALPIITILLILMFRSWMWSVNARN